MVDKAGPDPDAEVTGVTLSVVDLSTATPALTGLTDPALFIDGSDWSPDGTEMTQVTQIAADGGNAIQPTFTNDLGPATSDGYRAGNHPRIRPVN